MNNSLFPRIHNMGIVVASLDDAIALFSEIGLKLEGRSVIEGDWSGKVTGLHGQQVEIAMMATPDGNNRIELSRFIVPDVIADHRNAPVNALGYLRLMFTVADLDNLLTRLYALGVTLVDEVVNYENSYRLCYVRSADGLLIGLAEEVGH
ncbi:VOC family protein [Rurimicrobium arvi]|uniref:VOC family protein n=1 Tax=Rurimicrobium arvi TaxID=2049916 RepID=A0ABP8MRM4_9BACT